MNTLFFFNESGFESLYNDRGEKVYDLMEGVLTGINDFYVLH